MHEKHRQRVRNKLMFGGQMFEEHELLEILLYYSLPRVNTNEIAHDLITMFGSLENVLNADPQLLVHVKGIGEKTAAYLSTLGLVLEKCNKASDKLPQIFSFEQIKEPLKQMYKNVKDEVFIAFFLDTKYNIIGKRIICDHSAHKVDIDLSEFSKQILLIKPVFVAIAHNHLSNHAEPTEADDKATEKLCLLLRLYNVNLVDHLIVTADDVYSYYYENRIDSIKEKVERSL